MGNAERGVPVSTVKVCPPMFARIHHARIPIPWEGLYFMMRLAPIIVAVLLLMSVTALAQQPSVPEIPYESVPDLLKLPPDLYLGEAAGVALNSKGHIFVYTRSRQTRLFEFDRDGKFLGEIGKDLYGFDFAHVVRVD